MMGSRMQATRIIRRCLLVCALAAPAISPGRQQAPADEPAGPDETSPSQEVEVSEDNYRRYMELKDRPMERAPMPAEAYRSQDGLEKMQQLPESSQKHLRNQLREIILQGEAWQPEESGKMYPFEPSEAALSDSGLKRQEGEAWEQLVGEYHAREAAIHSAAQARQAGRPGSAAQTGQPPARNAGLQGQQQPRPGQQPPAGNGAAMSPPAPGGQQGEQAAGQATGPDGEAGTARDAAPARVVPAAPKSAQPGAIQVVVEKGVTENALRYLTGDCGEGDAKKEDSDCVPRPAEEERESRE